MMLMQNLKHILTFAYRSLSQRQCVHGKHDDDDDGDDDENDVNADVDDVPVIEHLLNVC